MAGFKPHILSNAIDQVHTTFFCGDYTQQMWSLPEETLYGHFVTTINNAFETELAQEDEDYENGSESFNIPTPLSKAQRVMEESFDHTHFGQSTISPGHHEEHSPQGYRSGSFTCH